MRSEPVDGVLVDGRCVDDLLATVQAPAPDAANAVDGLCALMGSTYAVLTAQADLVRLYLSRQG